MPKIGFPMPTAKNRFQILNLRPKKHIYIYIKKHGLKGKNTFFINIYFTEKSNECLRHFSRHYGNITRLSLFYIVSNKLLYFYNSKTRCDRRKQIAFLKSTLKSTMLIKKEKRIKNRINLHVITEPITFIAN